MDHARQACRTRDPDEFYLADLIALEARDTTGGVLGQVALVHDYGAGASLEIERTGGGAPLLVPFTRACVPLVDVAGGHVVVDPPDELEVRSAAE